MKMNLDCEELNLASVLKCIVLLFHMQELLSNVHVCSVQYKIMLLLPGAINFVNKLDIPKKSGGGSMSAMKRFQQMDTRGRDSEDSKVVTLHQNAIRYQRSRFYIIVSVLIYPISTICVALMVIIVVTRLVTVLVLLQAANFAQW